MACGTTIGSVIREERLAAWANFRQRALNVAIVEINAKIDLKIAVESVEQARHRRVTALIFATGTQALPKDSSKGKRFGSPPEIDQASYGSKGSKVD
jgi:hypothetical protein